MLLWTLVPTMAVTHTSTTVLRRYECLYSLGSQSTSLTISRISSSCRKHPHTLIRRAPGSAALTRSAGLVPPPHTSLTPSTHTRTRLGVSSRTPGTEWLWRPDMASASLKGSQLCDKKKEKNKNKGSWSPGSSSQAKSFCSFLRFHSPRRRNQEELQPLGLMTLMAGLYQIQN